MSLIAVYIYEANHNFFFTDGALIVARYLYQIQTEKRKARASHLQQDLGLAFVSKHGRYESAASEANVGLLGASASPSNGYHSYRDSTPHNLGAPVSLALDVEEYGDGQPWTHSNIEISEDNQKMIKATPVVPAIPGLPPSQLPRVSQLHNSQEVESSDPHDHPPAYDFVQRELGPEKAQI